MKKSEFFLFASLAIAATVAWTSVAPQSVDASALVGACMSYTHCDGEGPIECPFAECIGTLIQCEQNIPGRGALCSVDWSEQPCTGGPICTWANSYCDG